MNEIFACPSNIPDSGIGPATNYQLQSSPTVATNAVWQPTGDVVVGDDHLNTITLPATANTLFFRLTQ